MKIKMFVFVFVTVMVSPDVFPQQSSFWNRIPESIKSRKVFKRFEWDYIQRAYPYDTIPVTRYRQERNREISKSKLNAFADSYENMWHSIGPGGILFDSSLCSWGLTSGRVRAVAVHPTDPNTVYIGAASGGIWKTTNGGTAWLDIGKDLESLNFGAIAIDPNNPQTVYAGSGEAAAWSFAYYYDGKGLFKSIDGGQTWEIITDGFGDFTHFGDIAVHPGNSDIVLASLSSGNFFGGDSLPNEGIWKSSDAGLTWNRTLEGEDAFDIAFNPVNPAIVYASIGGMHQNSGFYISTDEGTTWTQSNVGLPVPSDIGRMQFDIAKSSPNILYAVIYKLGEDLLELNTKAFKSVNGGSTWSQISTGIPLGGNAGGWYDQGFYCLCIAVDPVNPNHVFIGNVELHETVDGSVFTPVRPYGNNAMGSLAHADYHQLVYAPSNSSYLYIGCDGGIYSSTDGGSTAASLNNGLATLQLYRIASSPFDSLVFMGGMQDNANAVTMDGGSTWNTVTGSDGMECFFDYEESIHVYASTQWGVLYRSNNGGNTFTGFGNKHGTWITPFFMHPTDHTILYVATRDLYKSTGGGPFTKITTDLIPAPAYISAIAQSRVNPDHMILATGFGELAYLPLTGDSLFFVKTSVDGGYTWNDVIGNIPGETRWISRVACDPVDANTMYILRTGFSASNKVYKTTDLGLTWANISGDLPDLPCNDIFIDPLNTDYIYVATDVGIYRTVNGGYTWEYQSAGMPFVPVLDFDYVEFGTKRLLRAGTHGRSIYETTLDNSVGLNRITNYELQIKIEPNPFSGSTTFHYTLGGPAQVTLQIFNIFGQSVDNPVNTFQAKGEQKVQWNAGSLPAGMYFYRIDAGGMVGTGKIIKF